MRTAIVTTCYLDTPEYLHKTIKFCNYYSNLLYQFEASHIILLDNGSKLENIDLLQKNTSKFVKMFSFDEHIPRKSHLEYGYLWRAVYKFKDLLTVYDKIIYMDNDFYILSDPLAHFTRTHQDGWSSLYCHKHNFPETGIQIVSKNSQKYKDFVKDLTEEEFIAKYNGKTMETTLPVTVNKNFVGDRWSEMDEREQRKVWDWSAQVELDTKVLYGLKDV